MKIESITTTQRNDGESLVVIWYKDKTRGITKGGLSFKSFKDKATAEAWLSGESIYNKRQADSMLAKIEEVNKPEKIENLQPANNTGLYWDFIEANFEGYDSSEKIALSNDFSLWLEGERDSLPDGLTISELVDNEVEIFRDSLLSYIRKQTGVGALISKLKQYPADKLPPVGLYSQLVTATELRNAWNCGEWLKYLEA